MLTTSIAGKADRVRFAAADAEHSRGDRVVDPRLLGLPAGSAYDADRPLASWPLRRLPDARVSGEQVWAPVEYVASAVADLPAHPPGGWLITPVTNGLGAGATL